VVLIQLFVVTKMVVLLLVLEPVEVLLVLEPVGVEPVPVFEEGQGEVVVNVLT